jgi:hypothetical protein
MADYELQNNTTKEYRPCRILRDSSQYGTDTAIITSQVIMFCLSGVYLDSPPRLFGRFYPLKCPPEVTFSASMFVSLDIPSAIRFLDPQEWQALLHTYEN